VRIRVKDTLKCHLCRDSLTGGYLEYIDELLN
jgi:hypothetical protein